MRTLRLLHLPLESFLAHLRVAQRPGVSVQRLAWPVGVMKPPFTDGVKQRVMPPGQGWAPEFTGRQTRRDAVALTPSILTHMSCAYMPMLAPSR